MTIVFKIQPGPNQRQRINQVKQRAISYLSKYEVAIAEDFAAEAAYVTVTTRNNPSYGAWMRRAIWPSENAIYWDWPENHIWGAGETGQ
jgi:hypothetical protein